VTEQSEVRSLGFARRGEVSFFSQVDEDPAEGQFQVQTLYSGFSATAELSLLDGWSPALRRSWDDDPGEAGASEPLMSYPLRSPGCMEVGRVTESRTPVVAIGQVLAMAYGHRSAYTADPQRDLFIPLPQDLDPLLGILVAHTGPDCANSLLHAAAERAGAAARDIGDGVRGRQVLVTGDDASAFLTALFALYGGAAGVAIATTQPELLAAAHTLGILALDNADGEADLDYTARWTHAPGDLGADVAFACGTDDASLRTAIRSLRPDGTLVITTAAPKSVPDTLLAVAFTRALRVRHAPLERVPPSLASLWDRRGLCMETVYLLQEYGTLLLDLLRADVVPFSAGLAALAELDAGARQPIQLTFAYSV